MQTWDVVTDFISIGSGGGGMVGALAARAHGLDSMVLEKREVIGGSTAKSGGVMWIPNNPLMGPAGVHDSYEDAMAYFDDVVGDVGPASSYERRHAFVTHGPQMVSFLQQEGVRFVRCEGWSDYYPDAKGGCVRGRSIEGRLWNGKVLGPWLDKVQHGNMWDRTHLAAYAGEIATLQNQDRSLRNRLIAARARARTKLALRRGRLPVTTGWSFIGQMLFRAIQRDIPAWTDSPLRDLVVEGDRVAGVVVEREGRDVRVRARKGVLFAAGGFAHNLEMRTKYLDPMAVTDYSMANPGDTGEVIELAIRCGAAIDLIDEAVWTPTSVVDGTPLGDWNRQRPGTIIVAADGQRFCNEANSYVEVVKAMLDRNRVTRAVPSWLIFDDGFRRRNVAPGIIPAQSSAGSAMYQAENLDDLAELCDIDPEGLRAQVDRFNQNARVGRDPEFGKGENAYNRYLGDPKVKPNNCLAPIEAPPFYAAPLYPGDVGTCGGILTDEHARVLNTAGEVMEGLYATGNCTASVMGRKYLGAGASIANSSVFGYVAARHASGAGEPQQG
ncbi:MAG: succinate dehydrogenase/fumarate reductase flavoprotein subunit [Acidimicrobiales bacterium]|jgi:3-oxosteroid 1-dehydrogenase|nr:succinate dehydrogenase/fumarate reductase flavoprotein subunit [Acidimicrobiales bacterium]